ncbi:MerR family transcriptional regulator [Bifidobacterium sp. 82T10]|uniref:MerR family transcriptional regulator n=1 Tax=Bifidobacterium miconis TaxID=2834435 RepID=A0ABS6WIP5_9BIFI|nr:MerR family transcriptional regulator [Bifidobacterium miconis]MBW3093625.1 MerR family transcriptional regulator [Bifidobacterium miconis]
MANDETDECRANGDERRYTIRDMAKRFHMEPSALRYYEDVGLLPGVERTASGQRIYRQWHVWRLGSICCFKDAGMTIDEIKRFFMYEANEDEHIDDMVELLTERRAAIEEQRRALEEAYHHVLRKLHFYGDIRDSLRDGTPRPDWKDYGDKVFTE